MSLTKMKDITRTGALTICIVVALMGVRFEKVQPRILASGIAEQAQLSVADSTLEEAQFSRLQQPGQYSAADCTGPQVVGSDSLFGCTNGMLYAANTLPTGTFHSFLVVTRPANAPNDPHFHFTAPGMSLVAFMNTEGQLRAFNPPGNQVYVAATSGPNGDFGDSCNRSGGGFPMRGCPTAYGRFFDIDSDNDSQFDDMEVVFIDGTAVPLNFRILFVPVNWTGTQAQFDAAAQNQVNLFAGSTGLGACLNTIETVTLDVGTQNFNTFNCTQNNCGLGSVRNFLRTLGLKVMSYDVVVGLLPAGASPCAPTVGCSNTIDTVWIEQSAQPNLAHEIGHIYALEDEYCSEEAGGHSNCAGAGDLNFLGADLGCNPNTGQGCCTCQNAAAPAGSGACSAACNPNPANGNYFGCCNGNQGNLGGGTRCIMAALGAGAGVQNWCQRCLNRLNGRTEFGCDALPTTPFRNVVAVDITLSSDGEVTLNAVETGEGRPTRVNPPGNRYRLRLDSSGGNLLDEAFSIIHYDVPLPQEEANFHYQAPVDFEPDSPPPMVLTVSDSGAEIFRKTVFGAAPVANDDTADTDEDSAVRIDVAANDTDADGDLDPSSTATQTDPAHGTLANNGDGSFDYTPDPDYNGSDGFTYEVCDSGEPEQCATASVTVTINPINDAPVLSPVSPVAVDEGAATAIDLDGIVSDVETPDSAISWVGSTTDADVATVNINTVTRQAVISGIDGPGTATIRLTATDRGDPDACVGGPPACSGQLSTSIDVTVSVNNVAPSTDAGADQTINEGDTVILAPASFTDPGILDTHTATIDWGDDSPAEPGSVTESNGSGSVSGSHVYGDDGAYSVTVSVCDNDGDCGQDSFTVSVQNLPPNATLNTWGAIAFAGGDAFLGRKGVEQTHQASATDPGSDDLIFDWSFGVTNVHFNDGVGPDPFPSPDGVFPFSANDTASVMFAAPGVHTIEIQVTDDDGGVDSGSLAKLVTDNHECTRSQGFWKEQFSARGKHAFDEITLVAYLDIVNFASAVFSEQVPASTIEEARAVMWASGPGLRDNAVSQILAAWLNFAQGAIGWDELIDTDHDGIADTPFHHVMAEGEVILLNPDATHKELEDAKDLAEAVNLHDADNPSCE